MKIVIEHLEKLSYWVWLEYLHVSKFVGKENLIFTNVKDEEERKKLKRIGEVFEKSVTEFDKNLIILDPKAEKELKKEEIGEDSYLVIGGICGDFEFTGKTWEFITSKLAKKENVLVRNLGKKQLTTDTAAITAWLIANGKKLSELKFTDYVEIEVFPGARVELPYGYLLINNTPLLTPGLIQIFEAEYFGIKNFPGAERIFVCPIFVKGKKVLIFKDKPTCREVKYGETLLSSLQKTFEAFNIVKIEDIDYLCDFFERNSKKIYFIVKIQDVCEKASLFSISELKRRKDLSKELKYALEKVKNKLYWEENKIK